MSGLVARAGRGLFLVQPPREVEPFQRELQGRRDQRGRLSVDLESLQQSRRARNVAGLLQQLRRGDEIPGVDLHPFFESCEQPAEVEAAQTTAEHVEDRLARELLEDLGFAALLERLELDAAHR